MKKVKWAQLEQNPSQQLQHFQYSRSRESAKACFSSYIQYYYIYVQYMEKIQFMFKVHIGLLKLVF